MDRGIAPYGRTARSGTAQIPHHRHLGYKTHRMLKQFPYRYRVLILLFFLSLITSIDRIAISLVSVRIKTEFGLSNEKMGWVLSVFALAYALFEIPAGVWADRVGQKRVLIRIVLWWSLFTALTGATTGLVSLLLTRFLFGAGES